MRKPIRRLWPIVPLVAGMLLAGHAQAQAYPSKPISVVVGYPPGGDTDAMARLFAEKLAERLKQPVLIDNRPGAGGTVGNAFVGKARPDGYTLLFTPNPFTTAPFVLKLSAGNSYDVLNGFEPVIKMATQPLVLVSHPSTGIRTVGDLVGKLRAGQGVTYGTPGAGSPMHVVAEWLNRAAGVKAAHVAYRGVGPSVTDVVGGHVNTVWATLGPVTQYFAEGKLLPVAVADAQRSPLAPSVPTLGEQGYKDVVVGSWNGFFAPKGTPKAIVNLLNEHLNEIVKMPDVIAKMATFGALPAGGAPEVLGKTNADEYATMGKLIQELGIRAD